MCVKVVHVHLSLFPLVAKLSEACTRVNVVLNIYMSCV